MCIWLLYYICYKLYGIIYGDKTNHEESVYAIPNILVYFILITMILELLMSEYVDFKTYAVYSCCLSETSQS